MGNFIYKLATFYILSGICKRTFASMYVMLHLVCTLIHTLYYIPQNSYSVKKIHTHTRTHTHTHIHIHIYTQLPKIKNDNLFTGRDLCGSQIEADVCTYTRTPDKIQNADSLHLKRLTKT